MRKIAWISMLTSQWKRFKSHHVRFFRNRNSRNHRARRTWGVIERLEVKTLLSAAPIPAGQETQITASLSGSQSTHSVASDATGDFVIAWSGLDPNGSGQQGIYAQQSDASGRQLGSAFLVSTLTTNQPFAASVAMDATGDFVVTWESGVPGNYQVYARLYNAAGIPEQAAEFEINTLTIATSPNPQVAMDAAGDFAISWQSEYQSASGNQYDIYARTFSSSGQSLQSSEFVVNSFTANVQKNPSVAMDSEGDFVVVWQSKNQASSGSNYDIYARTFQFSGLPNQTHESLVNVQLSNSQTAPSVAMDSTGNFVVAWQSNDQASGASATDIYARSFNQSAQPLESAEFLVGTSSEGFQTFPSVAMDSSGDFVVTWQSLDQVSSGSGQDIFSRTFDLSAESRETSEFQVNTTTNADQSLPSVAMDSSGDFVVVWQSSDTNESVLDFQRYVASSNASPTVVWPTWNNLTSTTAQLGGDVMLDGSSPLTAVGILYSLSSINANPQVGGTGVTSVACPVALGVFSVNISSLIPGADYSFVAYATNSNGTTYTTVSNIETPLATAIGNETQINSVTTGRQGAPKIASDARGDTVVVWSSYDNVHHGYTIAARLSNVQGLAQADQFQVNATTTRYADSPAVAMDAAGDFVVVWQSYDLVGQTSNFDIFAQRFNAAGIPQGVNFQVNTLTAGLQANSSVAMDSQGDFVVAWGSYLQRDNAAQYDVYARTFTAAGVAEQSSEFVVEQQTIGTLTSPSAAMDAQGDFVITWQSRGTSGINGQYDIYARTYSAAAVANQPAEFRVNQQIGSNQIAPSVAMDGSGDFVVAWESLNQASSNSEYDIYARQFSLAGLPRQTAEFLVNSATSGNQFAPVASIDLTGDFVIVWQTDGNQNNQQYDIDSQLFTAGGGVVGENIQVNTFTTGCQTSPTVAMDTTGDFVIGWQSLNQAGSTSNYDIYTRQYQAESIGAPIVINPTLISYAGTTAVLAGNLTSVGGSPLSAVGVLYSLTSANNDLVRGGPGVSEVDAAVNSVGQFIVNVNQLISGSVYSFVAFASNGNSTVYSTAATFTATANTKPTVAVAASAPASAVTSSTVSLSVLGADVDTGETSLTYTWTVVGAAPSVVTFSDNSTNSAKTTTATFSASGTYHFLVTITDPIGATATSTVTVIANIAPVVTAPVLLNIPSTPLPYGGTGTTLVMPGVTIFDPDSLTLRRATVQVSGNYQPGRDLLAATVAAGIAATFDPIAGLLTLTGTATLGAYTSVLRSVSYQCTTVVTAGLTQTFTIMVDDGLAVSPPAFRNIVINLTANQLYPVASLGDSLTYWVAGWQYMLQSYYSTPQITDFGIGGYTTRQIYDMWTSKVRHQGYPLISVLGGVNDLIHGVSATSAFSYLDQLYTEAMADGLMIHVYSMTPVGSEALWNPRMQVQIDLLNSMVAAKAEANSNLMTFYDSYSVMGDPTNPQRLNPAYDNGEGLHWNIAGHQLMASTFYAAFSPAVAQSIPTLILPTVTALSTTTASLGADVSNDGESAISARGVLVALTSINNNPTLGGTGVTEIDDTSPSTGIFNVNAQQLTAGAAYSFVAFATNSSGTTYSTVVNFTTQADQGPVITTAATPSGAVITGSSVQLAVLGDDLDSGEASLIYTWSTFGLVPGAVTFTANATNAAKNTTALFTAPGIYQLIVTITSPSGALVTSTTSVTVKSAVTSIVAGTTSVAAKSILVGPVSSLSIVFSHAMNAMKLGANSVENPANWSLSRNGNPIGNPISAITYASSSNTATITFSQPLIDGGYLLSATSTIFDAYGTALFGTVSGVAAAHFAQGFYVGQLVQGQLDVAPWLSGIETTAASLISVLSSPITGALMLSDADSPTCAGATVQITGGYQSDQDVLSFLNTARITGSWNPGTATLTLSGTDTLSNYRVALRNVLYHNTSATPNTTVIRTVAFTVSDGLENSNTVTRKLSVRVSTSTPALTGLSATVTYTQRAAAVNPFATLVTTDQENLPMASAMVAVTNWQAGDQLVFANTYGLQHTFVQDFNAHTALLTLTGNETAAHYSAELSTVNFMSVAAVLNPVSRVFTLTITNVISRSDVETVTMLAVPVKQAPVVSAIESTTAVYRTDYPDLPPLLSSLLQITDIDSTSLSGASVAISADYQNSSSNQDRLTFANKLGISGAFNPVTGVLTLTGLASLTSYRTALRSVTFSSTGSNISTATRTVTVSVTDDTSLTSNVASRNFSVQIGTEVPTLSGFSSMDTYNQGATAIAIAPSIVAADPGDVKLTQASVSFANWQAGDQVTFFNLYPFQHTLVTDLVNHTAVLTLSGTDTPAHYSAVLETVSFAARAGILVATPRIATIFVQNVVSGSASVSVTINVVPLKRPPVLSGLEVAALSYNPNHPELNAPPCTSTLVISDPDSTLLTGATVAISVGYQHDANGTDLLSFVNQSGITGQFNSDTGTLTLSGLSSVANYRTALRAVTFSTSGTNINTTTRTISFSVSDDTSLTSNTVTRSFSIATSNVSPTLQLPTGQTSNPLTTIYRAVDPSLVIADSDSSKLASATVTFTNWQSGDRLVFTNSAALLHVQVEDLTNHTMTLTLSRLSSVANYQATLRSMVFYTVAGKPVTTPRTFTIVVNDGYTSSQPVTGQVSLN